MPYLKKMNDRQGDSIGKRVFINKLNINREIIPSYEIPEITLNNIETFSKRRINLNRSKRYERNRLTILASSKFL